MIYSICPIAIAVVLVCSCISKNLGIAIQSHHQDMVQVELLNDEQKIREVYNNDSIVKLFFQKSNTYFGNTANWGNTKRLDHFNYVCAVLNTTSFKAFEEGKLIKLNPTTRNKFYVACTRARGYLYFIPEERLKAYRR